VYPHTGGRDTLVSSCPHCGGLPGFGPHPARCSALRFFARILSWLFSHFCSCLFCRFFAVSSRHRYPRVPVSWCPTIAAIGGLRPLRGTPIATFHSCLLRFRAPHAVLTLSVARCRGKPRTKPLWEPGSASAIYFLLRCCFFLIGSFSFYCFLSHRLFLFLCRFFSLPQTRRVQCSTDVWGPAAVSLPAFLCSTSDVQSHPVSGGRRHGRSKQKINA
jgi:hypothetical protein